MPIKINHDKFSVSSPILDDKQLFAIKQQIVRKTIKQAKELRYTEILSSDDCDAIIGSWIMQLWNDLKEKGIVYITNSTGEMV